LPSKPSDLFSSFEEMMGLAATGLGFGDPPADYGSIAAVGLFVALMCVCIVVGHLLEENRWMNESTTALLIVSLPYIYAFSVLLLLLGLDARWFYCGVAGALHRHSHPARLKREAVAHTSLQRGSLLHLPPAANHFQCRVCTGFSFSTYILDDPREIVIKTAVF
jgi:hypothetical protein